MVCIFLTQQMWSHLLNSHNTFTFFVQYVKAEIQDSHDIHVVRIHVFVVCVRPLTSNSLTSRRHFPKHEGHGVNVSLFKGLDVLQIQTGLQHLRGHVTCRTHLQHRDTRRDKHTNTPLQTRTLIIGLLLVSDFESGRKKTTGISDHCHSSSPLKY